MDTHLKMAGCPKEYQDSEPKAGLVETSGRVSPGSSHPQVISPCSLGDWGIRTLVAKNTFMRTDGCCRGEVLCAPAKWGPKGALRIWKSQALAHGLNDAPAATNEAAQRNLLRPGSLLFQASSLDPSL